MSLQNIQKEIVEVMRTYFSDQHFIEESFDTTDNKVRKLNIFEQSVPDRSVEDGVEEDWEYPFITVSLVSGSVADDKRTKIRLGIGLKDGDLKYTGHQTMLSIIEKIGLLLKETTSFVYSTPEQSYDWAVNEEEYYPYYFGVVETHWNHM